MRGAAGIVAVLLLWLAGCASAPAPGLVPAPPQTAAAPEPPLYPGDGQRGKVTVVRVVDGDTVVVRSEGHELVVRLLGINAPELRPRQCGAQSATDHLTDLAPAGSPVVLVDDTGEPDTDLYGRALAYLRTPDGRDASLELVTAGWARVYDRYPTSATPTLREAQRRAQSAQRGIWVDDHCPP